MTSRIKFLLLLCLGLWTLDFGPWTCRAGNAVITLLDGQGNPVTNTRVVLTSSSLPQSQNGGTAVQWRTSACTDANGQINLTNAVPGSWQVQPVNQNLAVFTFLMPITNGTIRAEDFLIAAAGNTLPPDTFSYGVNASDRRYDAAGTAARATLNALTQGSNAFAASLISTNFTVTVITGAGYAAANGQYGNYDWNDIVNANCVNATNGNLYLLGGGATNPSVTLTTNVLEIDDYSGGGVNIYYATNFSTNAAQIVWFAAATNYLPVPGSQAFTATNLAVGLGPVPVAQVATQIQNALLIGGTNVETSLAALAYPPGFNGAGLTNVAPTGPQIWGTWAGPQFVIYVAPYDLNTEAQVTNAIRTLVRMPQFTNLTNAGIGFTMIMDVNATFRRNAAGVLQWNYSLYPHGPNFLTGLCAANGIGSVCAEYGDTVVHLPPGAAGAVCSVSGGGPNSVIIYTGTNGVAYGTNYSDCALPEEFPADLSVIQSWGFGGVMVNDLASGGTLQQQWQLQSEAGAICANLRNASNIPFGYIAFDTPPGAGPGRALGNYTRTLHSAIAYDQDETDAETFLRGYSQDFAGGPAAGQGAWQVNNIFNSPQPQMTVNALISGWITPGWGGNEILNLTNEPCLTLATNALWQLIETDPLQTLPRKTQDFGVNGSVWLKPLVNGNFALGIFNGSNAPANVTFTLPAAWQTAYGYTVSNVWTGAFQGLLTNSMTLTNLAARGNSNSAALLLCKPVY